MGYAIFTDWQEEFSEHFEDWENYSSITIRQILEDTEHTRFKEIAEQLGVYNKDNEELLEDYWEESIDEHTNPIYNFIYPLETTPSDEDILKVSLNTNCCVMCKDEKYYLSLTGCGMDLSQDIALSYIWLESWIPYDLVINVCSQKGLSVSGKHFEELKEGILKTVEANKNQLERIKETWKDK